MNSSAVLPFPALARPKPIRAGRAYWLGGRTYWLGQGVSWLLICSLLFAGNLVTNNGKEWLDFFLVRLVTFLLGIITSHGIRLMIFSVRERPLDWHLAVRVLAAVALASLAMQQTLDLVFWLTGALKSPLGLFGIRINRLITTIFMPRHVDGPLSPDGAITGGISRAGGSCCN